VKKDIWERRFALLGYILLITFSLLCFLPFIFIISGSFSNETEVIKHGFGLIPQGFSLEAYKVAFKNPFDLLNAYGVSVLVVVSGTSCGLFIIAMTGYVLSRKDFKYRNKFSFLIYFTSVFSGGLVPWYIMMVNYLHLKDNILALILPGLLNVFYIIVMKSFMSGIPFEIIESAKMDGANEFSIFIKIIMPISIPSLTTIGVFITLGYWNDFFCAMLFINNQNLLPLQYYLYRLVNTADALTRIAAMTGIAVQQMPTQTLKLAMTVLAVIPIMCVYPFAQKHIVGGVTIGAVKG
jgi:putative aldouronate transport system permease protein